MKFTSNAAGAAIVAILAAAPGQAQEKRDPSDLLNDCSAEIQTFCSKVTRGQGRMLACFAAHEDKLSARCLNALYDFSDRLEAMSNTIAFVGRSCSNDIDQFCADVKPGEGRIAQCLDTNYEKATPICQQAMLGVGIHK